MFFPEEPGPSHLSILWWRMKLSFTSEPNSAWFYGRLWEVGTPTPCFFLQESTNSNHVLTEDTTGKELLCLETYFCSSLLVLLHAGGIRRRKRWRRNRMGRPLSPSQIPQKNISTPSKLHKTTSVGWQRTSDNQKSRPLSSKTVFYFSSNFYFFHSVIDPLNTY